VRLAFLRFERIAAEVQRDEEGATTEKISVDTNHNGIPHTCRCTASNGFSPRILAWQEKGWATFTGKVTRPV
jgi:hypothetical protein